MDFENLTPEQKEKAIACTSPGELVALAQDEGIELTDEQLDAISGGWESDGKTNQVTTLC